MKNALMCILSAVLFLAGAAGFGGQDSGSLFDEADRFLKKYVDQGLIDYAAIRNDPAMLEHLVDESVKHKAQVMFLEVRPSNTRAVALYQQSGFNEIGLRKNYYDSKSGREDALVMARYLPAD